MKVVLVRHGQSEWNEKNLFTGWCDVDLTPKGIEEAKMAGQLLKKHHIQFDRVYFSVLKRAIKTGHIILEEIDQTWLPEMKTWRLNERHYGALQGLNKQETIEKYGEEQVHLWRRSYDVMPPLLEEEQELDRRYHELQKRDQPQGETLKTTLERVIPFWQDQAVPKLLNGENLLIVAHGNSLRSLVKYLLNLSKDEILQFELPTAKPLVFELSKELEVNRYYYLDEIESDSNHSR